MRRPRCRGHQPDRSSFWIPFTTSSQCTAVYVCTWDSDAPFSWRKNKNQDVTQGFYFANKYYEHLKAPPIGFTAQLGNFERAGGDPLLLNVLDGADTDKGFPDRNHIDNANMSTPPDGIPPTMQTYLNHTPGTKPATDPYLPASSSDSADDIFHEYTHGLSPIAWLWMRVATPRSTACRPVRWVRLGAISTPRTSWSRKG
jgi:extracellular elastinolytic metalloproteinase